MSRSPELTSFALSHAYRTVAAVLAALAAAGTPAQHCEPPRMSVHMNTPIHMLLPRGSLDASASDIRKLKASTASHTRKTLSIVSYPVLEAGVGRGGNS